MLLSIMTNSSDIQRYFKDDSLPNGWWMEPITSAILFLADEAAFGGITKRAVGSLSMAGMSLPLVIDHPTLKLPEEGKMAFLRLAKEFESASNLAKSLSISEQEFNRMNKHSLVSIWNVFETSLEDLLIGLLVNQEEPYKKLTSLNLGKLKPEDFQFESLSDAANVVKRLKSPLLQEGKDMITAYESIYSCFGASFKTSDEAKEKIKEIKHIRNCLVHRKGYVDAKTVEKVPSLSRFPSGEIVILEGDYQACHSVLGD